MGNTARVEVVRDGRLWSCSIPSKEWICGACVTFPVDAKLGEKCDCGAEVVRIVRMDGQVEVADFASPEAPAAKESTESPPPSSDPPREPTARKGDPLTSWKASRVVRAPTIRQKIMVVLWSRGTYGATCDELAAETGDRLQSITPRMRELADRGLAVKTNDKRPGDAGVEREVWVALGAVNLGAEEPVAEEQA
jgi:hypothetical protein